MSPANEPVVRSLWAGQAAPDRLTGITGFSFDESVSAEDLFLAEHFKRLETEGGDPTQTICSV
jgi:hypothetical protein